MQSKLVNRSAFEAETAMEIRLREAYSSLEPKLKAPFPLTIPTPEEYSALNRAILYCILCETNIAAEVHIKHLHGIVTDGYEYFTALLVNVVNELYGSLVDSAKRRLIRVTHEMVNVAAVGFDGLLVALLRQIVGGDFGEENLWLSFEMVNLFSSKWECLIEEMPVVMTGALYVFLRLLADHCRVNVPNIEPLRRMEIDFCVRVLRENFSSCLMVGRDLIRLLQDLVNVPELCAVWKDLLYNPKTFKVIEFVDISQIYSTRTSKWYFLLRLTPQMESQLKFLLTHVKFGSQKRYQSWFAQKFFSVPNRSGAVVDIVRFICCSVHPSNEIIHSGIIPRWAVIGWLLKSDFQSYVAANLKLALFYDWLFFDEKMDSIMNIEPAVLLMVHSIPRYIDITHTLLEFLFMLLDNYDVERKAIVSRGISTAFQTLVRKVSQAL
ncbi:uncharacterized protein LOC127240359 isoform X2 [Andrographis paniculata]|uniref:uncharacterized protein LOC127240359 isoform X2 n=1 Tax=Andrographis paniculata TaxID=175694 RepID=UPI0021E8A80D|nr:uncharacterized protein LOC127240359 isoform X2 [Andrographis paniculata]